jgi:hypothetical protein
MAISSWRLPPWLSDPAGRSARCDRPTACSAALAMSPLALQWPALSQKASGRGCAACAHSRQFSNTENSGKMVVRW